MTAWWCDKCEVPLLSPTCSACGSVSHRTLAADLAPVFAEELAFLRKSLGFEQLPKTPRDFYLWNSGVHYFRLGKRVGTVRDLQRDRPRAELRSAEDLRRRPCHPNASLTARLVRANEEHLSVLENEALSFIRSTASEYPGHALMVAFSGGKDSTAVSLLARQAIGHSSVLHIFSNTTIEAPDTYEYLSLFQRENPKVPLVRVEPTADFLDMCSTIGPPSRILRWCCSSHKATPMARVVSALSQGNEGVLTLDGIRAAESTRRSKYARITRDPKIQNEILASPILHWSDLEVWTYILAQGASFNRGYRRGFRRMGCLPCPFNSHWSDLLIQHNYPTDHREWRQFLLEHATRIGHPNPPQFSEQGWRARAGGNGLAHQRASLRKEICEREANTFTYELARPWTDAALEFLRPLGTVRRVSDDGVILRVELLDAVARSMIANLRISRTRSHLRVHFADQRNLRLFIQRFERQLRKYQSCVLCGSCAFSCSRGALTVNGRFCVDQLACSSCLRCVSAPCVAEESLKRKGQSLEWGVCDGSN